MRWPRKPVQARADPAGFDLCPVFPRSFGREDPDVLSREGRPQAPEPGLDTGEFHYFRFAHVVVAHFVRAGPDGPFLATVRQENDDRLWETETGTSVRASQRP